MNLPYLESVDYASRLHVKAQSHNQGAQVVEDYSAYVGLDVHKETIAVAVAYLGRSEPTSLGNIANTKKSVVRLIDVNRLPGALPRIRGIVSGIVAEVRKGVVVETLDLSPEFLTF